jgi:hypothetical protein
VKILACKSMRAAVVASGLLLVLGVILLAFPLATSSSGVNALSVLIYPGFAALIMSPIVLLSATLASLIPSVNSRMQDCQH